MSGFRFGVQGFGFLLFRLSGGLLTRLGCGAEDCGVMSHERGLCRVRVNYTKAQVCVKRKSPIRAPSSLVACERLHRLSFNSRQ